MTNLQSKFVSYTLGTLVGLGVLWYTWPSIFPPTKSPHNVLQNAPSSAPAANLSDAATIERVKAQLSKSGTTQPTPPTPLPVPTTQFTGSDIDPTTGQKRLPHPQPKPGEILAMTIKELGNFSFDPLKDSTIPADVNALDGSTVRLKGYIWPLGQSDILTEFILVPSLTSCCFGQPPGVQHIITVRLPPQKGIPFVTDPVQITGTLHIRIQREDDYTSNIFDLAATSVIADPE